MLKRSSNFKELSAGKGIWDLPGGTLEFGEPLKDALERELKEETAIAGINGTLAIADALSFTVEDDYRITHRINIIYTMEIENTPQISLSEEHEAYKFLEEIEEVQKLEMMQPIKDFVISQLEKRNR